MQLSFVEIGSIYNTTCVSWSNDINKIMVKIKQNNGKNGNRVLYHRFAHYFTIRLFEYKRAAFTHISKETTGIRFV